MAEDFRRSYANTRSTGPNAAEEELKIVDNTPDISMYRESTREE